MKWGVFVFFVLFVNFVSAEIVDVSLGRWQSHEFQGKNITILNLNEEDNKAIICVNNVKTIISDEKEKNIDHVSIDLKRVGNGAASIRLDGTCRNCECDSNCDNNLCGIPSNQVSETNEELDNDNALETEENEQRISLTGEPIEESDFMLLTSTLFVVVVILGAIVFIKRSMI